MRVIRLTLLLIIFFIPFTSSTLDASEPIRPIFKQYKITLVPTNENFSKSEFVRTVIVLKHRLRDSGAKFKLKATDDLEIKITFKNESEFKRVKDLIFLNSKINFYVIDYFEKQNKVLSDLLIENGIEFYLSNMGMFCFEAEHKQKEKINEIIKSSNNNMDFCWGMTTNDQERIWLYLIREKSKLTNKHIDKSWVDISKHTNLPEIYLSFDEEGAELFKDLTGNNINNSIAITINDIVYTAPKVQATISGGRCMISGNFTEYEADKLSILLNYGSLPLNLEIKED